MEKLSKRDKRVERKKRKAEAFLRLVKEDDLGPESKKMKRDESDHSGASAKSHVEHKNGLLAPKSLLKSPSNSKAAAATQTLTSREELKALRARLRARQKRIMWPKLFMKTEYQSLSLEPSSQEQSASTPTQYPSPLIMMDIQSVMLFAIQGNLCSYKPRFCKLLRVGKIAKVMTIVLNGLSLEDYQENQECFPFVKDSFLIKVPVISPTQYLGSVQEDLFTVPFSGSHLRKVQLEEKPGRKSSREARQYQKELHENKVLLPAKIKVTEDTSTSNLEDSSRIYNRVNLLLNPRQMLKEKYPLPLNCGKNRRGELSHYVYTKDKYEEVKPTSPLFAIDCEMCETTVSHSEVTWIAVVNEQLEVIYQSYVKPHNKITNYLTKYSGITKESLKDCRTRLKDVQEKLREILPPDAILCGQSFNHDLHALQMFHPYVIDTSCIYNLSGNRSVKSGLKVLASIFLGEKIQAKDDGIEGHNPVQDATATMKLVQHKLHYDHYGYGDLILHNESEAIKLKNLRMTGTNPEMTRKNVFFVRPGTSETQSLFDITKELKKKVLLVDTKDVSEAYRDAIDEVVITDNDKSSVNMVRNKIDDFHVCHVELRGGESCQDEDDKTKRKTLKKLDKKVKKLVSTLAEKSLVIVIMPGQSDVESHDALGCLQFAGWESVKESRLIT